MAILRTIPTGDLAIEHSAFVFIEGPEFVRQKLATRFQFFKGEWFLDKRQGIPYFRDVFINRPNLDVIRSLFRRVILSTPGVAAVKTLTVARIPGTRKADVSFIAPLTNGSVVVVQPGDDAFLVDVP